MGPFVIEVPYWLQKCRSKVQENDSNDIQFSFMIENTWFNAYFSKCKIADVKKHLHLGHLVDTFVQSDIQEVYLSQDRNHNISPSIK